VGVGVGVLGLHVGGLVVLGWMTEVFVFLCVCVCVCVYCVLVCVYVYVHIVSTCRMLTDPGNTKGGSITIPLTCCLTGLESAEYQLTFFIE
jgi:hypothetical protein